MDYLNKVLGIQMKYEKSGLHSYPNFINTRYVLKMVSLDGEKAVFVYPKSGLGQIDALKKHVLRIQNDEKLPVVIILNELTYRQKEYLIREKIPFIVQNKQIYLPFMAIYLQEKCDMPIKTDKVLPSAQLLFLYFLYGGANEILTSKAARDLCLTPTSISRASRQLEELGLLNVRKEGVSKYLFSNNTPKELFQNTKDKLMNPIKRTIYISKDFVDKKFLKSGYTALANYSMLGEPNIEYYASDSISYYEDNSTDILYNSEKQVALELWRYDPRRLSNDNNVDILSLALALKNDNDERVNGEIEEMLNNLWRKLDDKRN